MMGFANGQGKEGKDFELGMGWEDHMHDAIPLMLMANWI